MEKMDETARNFIDAFVQEDLSQGNRCFYKNEEVDRLLDEGRA